MQVILVFMKSFELFYPLKFPKSIKKCKIKTSFCYVSLQNSCKIVNTFSIPSVNQAKCWFFSKYQARILQEQNCRKKLNQEQEENLQNIQQVLRFSACPQYALQYWSKWLWYSILIFAETHLTDWGRLIQTDI